MSDRECFDYEQSEDESDCPLCCILTKYFLVFVLICFFIVIPFVMIFVGITYRYCDDMFTAWLITGRKIYGMGDMVTDNLCMQGYRVSLKMKDLYFRL